MGSPPQELEFNGPVGPGNSSICIFVNVQFIELLTQLKILVSKNHPVHCNYLTNFAKMLNLHAEMSSSTDYIKSNTILQYPTLKVESSDWYQ